MKSKMKSTFAIIAVALMVIVAVVPMVGVFTEESEAAAKIIPATDTSEITVVVNVYNASNTADTSWTGSIKITYGSYVQTAAQEATPVSTKTFKLYEPTVSIATITMVDEYGDVVSDYSSVTLNNLETGKSYTASLVKGHTQGTATFTFATPGADAITSAILGDKEITAGYTIFDKVGNDYVAVDSGKFYDITISATSLTGKYLYPAVTTGKYISVTSFTVSGISSSAISFDPAGYKQLANTETFNAKQTLVSIAPDKVSSLAYSVSSITGTKGTTALTFNPISTSIGPTVADKAYYSVEVPTDTGAYSVTMEVTDGVTKQSVAGTSLPTSYTLKDAFFGQVYMFGQDYVQAGTLEADIASATTSADPIHVRATVDSDGKFFMFVEGAASNGAITNLKYGLADGTVFDFTSASRSFSGNTALGTPTIDNSGYRAVNITLTLDGTVNNVIAGKELTISGSKTFGSLKTGTTGIAKFMAERGKTIEISVSDAQLSGDVSILVPIGTVTTAVTGAVKMSNQAVSIKVQDALGNYLTNATVYLKDSNKTTAKTIITDQTGNVLVKDDTNEVYKANIRADATPSSYYVWITLDDYTFTKALYVKDQAYKAEEAVYSFSLYQPSGTLITKQGIDQTATGTALVATDVSAYVTSVYKNSNGSIVFDQKTSVQLSMVTSGSGIFTTSKPVKANYLKYTDSDISTTEITALAAYPGANAKTAGIFLDAYLLTADSDGKCAITASVDSLTATLTRLDGASPIAGALVKLGTVSGNTFTILDSGAYAYTQNDGTFTVYTQVAIDSNTKVQFSGLDYVWKADSSLDSAIKDGAKVTAFKPVEDDYTIAFEDADEEPIEVTATSYPTITGATYKAIVGTAPTNVVKYTAAWTDETEPLKVTFATKATFLDYALSSEDRASGVFAISSVQSSYLFQSVDANGDALGSVTVTMKKYYGDQPEDFANNTFTTSGEVATLGLKVIRLPYVGDAPDTKYGFVATKDNYIFDSEVTEITDVFVEVESINALITINLKDAAGVSLKDVYTPTAVTVYIGDKVGPAATPGNGKFTFYGIEGVDYTFTVTKANSPYNFEPELTAEDNVLYANEETVYGDIVDADGFAIAVPNGTTVKAYYTATKFVTSDAYAENEHHYKIIVDKDKVKYYAVEAFGNYHFANSKTCVIHAKESTVIFTAVSANGYSLTATFTNPKAFNANGEKIGTAIENGVVVDVTDVAYYQVEAVNSTGYKFENYSLTPVFVANETFLTGTVPYSGKGTGTATLELYLEGNMVKEIKGDNVKIVDKYYYEAILDLSGYIGETAGVVFDSIIVVYYENGVELGYAAVDPYSTVNNIVTPEVEVYVAVLDVPSALISRHVSIAQVGNTATVSADGQFIVADDDAIYTDGQYIYTFAGWYVDNEKVSSAPSFTFSLTENVVIVPEYTVKYEKISDANAQVDPEIIIEEITKENTGIDTNVLIIGIAAVIVALIAVVYAVIKKE